MDACQYPASACHIEGWEDLCLFRAEKYVPFQNHSFCCALSPLMQQTVLTTAHQYMMIDPISLRIAYLNINTMQTHAVLPWGVQH